MIWIQDLLGSLIHQSQFAERLPGVGRERSGQCWRPSSLSQHGSRRPTMQHQHVLAQFGPGGEPVAADGADGLPAVPGEVLAATGAVGQELAAARYRAELSASWQTYTQPVRDRQFPGKTATISNYDNYRYVAGANPGGRGAGSGAHPWDGGIRAEGAGSFVSRAERRDAGVTCMVVQHHSSIIWQ